MDGGSGFGHFLANALNGLSLTYNESDSFSPMSPAQDIFLRDRSFSRRRSIIREVTDEVHRA